MIIKVEKTPVRTSPILPTLALFLLSSVLLLIIGQMFGYSVFEYLSDPYEELRGICDSVPAITKEEYSSRIVRLAKEMIQQDIDVYITEPGASMRYFVNVTWSRSERPFLLVVKQDSSFFYISPSFERDTARERVGPGPEIKLWEEDESPYELVNEALGYPKDLKILIEWDTRFHITNGIKNALASTNNINIGTDVVRNVRGYKSKSEIDLMRCANVATKKAIEIVSHQLYLGITEPEVKVMMKAALESAGLTNTWYTVLFGENAAYPHGTQNNKPLARGDLVLIDTGGELRGYQSDITRTFPYPTGAYSEWQDHMWNAVRKAQQAAIDKIAIGVNIGELDAAARKVMEENGYGGKYEFFRHRLGHGIGMEGHEEFYAVKGNEVPLQPGMCFSVEPGIYEISKGGVRIEDIVCMTTEYPYYELFGPTSDNIDNPLAGH